MMATTAKKKTGKPSDLQGKRLRFLEEFYPTYADASNRGKTRDIWDDMFARYWGTFPWRLPLKQDPDPTDPTDYAKKPQNPEEEDEKGKLITATETVRSYVNVLVG
jgi:hypothetical protein